MARATPVPDWVPSDLPAQPGVYHFVDAAGNTLYVGKSVNLRRRVRGYFYGSGPDDARLAEMLRIARSVRFHRAGSDLEARLDEAETILASRPPYNRAIKKEWRGWYLEIRWNDPFPRFQLVRATRHVGSQYFGPFYGRRLPDEIRRLTEKLCRLRSCQDPVRPDPSASACLQYELGLCTAPCIKAVGLNEYRAQMRAAARLLSDAGYAWELHRKLEESRDDASRRLAFEEAAQAQARLEWLQQLESFRFALDSDAGLRSWLIVLPGPGEQDRVLLPVAQGRVLPRRRVPWETNEWIPAIEDACYAVRVGQLRASSVFPPEEMVPSMLVTRWLENGAPDGLAFDLGRQGSDDVIRRLRQSPAEALAGPRS